MPASKQIRTRTKRNTFGLFDVDNDVKDYVLAIKANGGSIGNKAIYAVNKFVKGCKRDGVWDLLLDVGIFVGVDNLNAALVKLKTVPGVSRILINNNFVEGDYTKEGSSAGLLADGASKYLSTLYSVPIKTSGGLSFYTTSGSSINANISMINAYSSITGEDRFAIYRTTTGATQWANGTGGISSRSSITETPTPSAFYHVSRSSNVTTAYRNGAALDSITPLPRVTTTDSVSIFASSGGGNASNFLGSFYSIDLGMSASQASQFSSRVNSLMTQFGANKY